MKTKMYFLIIMVIMMMICYDVCDQNMIGFDAHPKVGELLWGYEEPLLVGATMVLPPEEVKIMMIMCMRS